MLIRLGFEIAYRFVQPTPMVVMLDIHGSRSGDVVASVPLHTDPAVPLRRYRDEFGNTCVRLHAPAGLLVLAADAVVRDSGQPDRQQPDAMQVPVEALPEDTLVFLRGSRYCETDALMQYAWDHFGHVPAGWARVQAICDHVHAAIEFGYPHADATRGAGLPARCRPRLVHDRNLDPLLIKAGLSARRGTKEQCRHRPRGRPTPSMARTVHGHPFGRTGLARTAGKHCRDPLQL